MADSPAAGKERRTATATEATGSAADDSDPSGDPSGGGSADDQASRSAFFSVRIITIDYYMIKPVAGLHVQRTPLTAQRISKLPVVRVFGTTPGGQKTCLHLHGLFPYFLLPCTGRGGVWEGQPLGTWENRAGDIANFVDAIDAAIRVTLWGGRSEAPSAAGPVGPVPTTMDAATAALPRQFQGTTFVYNVTVVRAKRFYGYHAEEEPFLKMFFLNPAIMTKAVNLLRAGAIKGRRYLPHDAHIPFHLQVMIDYNLAGMGFVNLSHVFFRGPIKPHRLADRLRLETQRSQARASGRAANAPSTERRRSSQRMLSFAFFDEANTDFGRWLPGPVPGGAHPPQFARDSMTHLEVDSLAACVLNRHEIGGAGDLAIDSDETFVTSLYPLWDDERKRRQAAGRPTTFTPKRTFERNPKAPAFEATLWNDLALILDRLGVRMPPPIASSPGGIATPRSRRVPVEAPVDCSPLILSSQRWRSQSSQQSNVSTDGESLAAMLDRMRDLASGEVDLEDLLGSGSASGGSDGVLDAPAAAGGDGDRGDGEDQRSLLVRMSQAQERAETREVDDILAFMTPVDGQGGNGGGLFGGGDHHAIDTAGHSGADSGNDGNVWSSGGVGGADAVNNADVDGDGDSNGSFRIPTASPLPQWDGHGDRPDANDNSDQRDAASEEAPPRAKPTRVARGWKRRHSNDDPHADAGMELTPAASAASAGVARRVVKARVEAPADRIARERRQRAKAKRARKRAGRKRKAKEMELALTWVGMEIRSDQVTDTHDFGRCIFSTAVAPDARRPSGEPWTDVLALWSPPPSPRRGDAGTGTPASPPCASSPSAPMAATLLIGQSRDTGGSAGDEKNRHNFALDNGSGTLSSTGRPGGSLENRIRSGASDRGTRGSVEAMVWSSTTHNPPGHSSPAGGMGGGTPVSPVGDRGHRRAAPASITPPPPPPSPPQSAAHGRADAVFLPAAARHRGGIALTPIQGPPTVADLRATGFPPVFYQEPFYSRPGDRIKPVGVVTNRTFVWDDGAPKPFEIGGRVHQPPTSINRAALAVGRAFVPRSVPPTVAATRAWLAERDKVGGGRAKVKAAGGGRGGDGLRSTPVRVPLRPRGHSGVAVVPAREASPGADSAVVGGGAPVAPTRPSPLPMPHSPSRLAVSQSSQSFSPRHRANLSFTPRLARTPPVVSPSGDGGKREVMPPPPRLPRKGQAPRSESQAQRRAAVEAAAAARAAGLQAAEALEARRAVAALRRGAAESEARAAAASKAAGRALVSQIEGVTPANTYAFEYTPVDLGGSVALYENQQVTLMGVEVFARSRDDLLPHPSHDPVLAIAYTIADDTLKWLEGAAYRHTVGVFVVAEPGVGGALFGLPPRYGVSVFANENELLSAFASFVRLAVDPDIVVGYDVQKESWGYLIDRAAALGLNFPDMVARVQGDENAFAREADAYGFDHNSGIHLIGRVVLNVWRIMRKEVTLRIYSYENVVFHILHRRVAKRTPRELTAAFAAVPSRHRTLAYIIHRTETCVELLEALDLVGRTSEFSRVYGIEFFAVLSRGSQYRVESMMFRLAKPRNYVMVSPGREEVAAMAAPECVPLVMEPNSRFYTSPLLVLDFQSLYPSIVIAYNYCYSTCLGRISAELAAGKGGRLGVADYLPDPAFVAGLEASGELNVSPNGVMFCAPTVRTGILPRLLKEILDTRIMVKAALKEAKREAALGDANAKARARLLDARQMALKLIANVTYGYTSANFSGRMPCVDIADSIVQMGRSTLERAIATIEERWNAQVAYGDTDSVFVLLPGATPEEAFDIADEIVEVVTSENPPPVTLKFEKVYFPCVLLSKKRYVGYAYETRDQVEPIFDAKGIETVRRDVVPAVAKIMEKTLRMLFETRDLSAIRAYLERQWLKIHAGRVSVKDFVFAKEVRLGTYAEGRTPPPVALVAQKKMARDPRAEPRMKERIPYVVIYGVPGCNLNDVVVAPEELLHSGGSVHLNATYYCVKQIIPPLDRVFVTMGVDLRAWYAQLARPRRMHITPLRAPAAAATRPGTLDQFFTSDHCAVCRGLLRGAVGVCGVCRADPAATVVAIQTRVRELERQGAGYAAICRQCTNDPAFDGPCASLDCPVMFEFLKNREALVVMGTYRSLGTDEEPL